MNNQVLPYVYKGTNPETNEFYIGYREANKVPAGQDLGFEYFTSASKVKERFDQFQWEIVAEFATGDEAYDYEQLLIFESWNTEGLLNKHCTHGKERFRLTGPFTDEHKEKISKSMKGENNPNFGKDRSGENNPMFGNHHTLEACEKMSKAKKGENHPMFGNHHTSETKQKISKVMKGRYVSDETKEKISKARKGKTGETAPNYGNHHTEEARKKISESLKGKPKLTCPYCSKECSPSNAKQWHFDNCKQKNTNK